MDPPPPPAPAANDAPLREPMAAQLGSPPPWERWSEVPRDPDLVKDLGPWCLEIFSGSAGISAAWKDRGLLVLPPIDVTPSALVLEPIDLLDATIFDFLLLLCRMGAVSFLHLGTPCSSFSIARSRPGGPPPLRSQAEPLGLAKNSQPAQWQLTLANELLFRSLELFATLVQAGGDATLENPRSSLMWQVPQVQQLKLKLHLYNVDLDQCQFGSLFRKPTRFLVSDARLLTLARTCDGGHAHLPLKGRVRSATNEVVFLTKVAQEYPTQLCYQFAEVTHSIVFGIFPQFQPSSWLPLNRIASVGSVTRSFGMVIVRNKLLVLLAPVGTSSNAVPLSRCSMWNASPGSRSSGLFRQLTLSQFGQFCQTTS